MVAVNGLYDTIQSAPKKADPAAKFIGSMTGELLAILLIGLGGLLLARTAAPGLILPALALIVAGIARATPSIQIFQEENAAAFDTMLFYLLAGLGTILLIVGI